MDNELIDLWTSKFLAEFERPSTASYPRDKRKVEVAFGRSTYGVKSTRPRSVSTVSPMKSVPAIGVGRRIRVSSIHTPTKLSESRAHLTLQRQRTNQDSKMQGIQMLSFKQDRRKAEETRKRMSQYSRELSLGARSQLSREIDSITRLVVKSFKSVILAERCALFLHDESKEELYFKPVGDNESHARLKEIRFPSKTGVAGWVATNKQCLNIPNAYKDHRFNSDIDKKTGFRTRTILCHPVLSDDNKLLGVIQMVNKRKGDARELRDKAKKKRTNNSHKGYNSCFEPFSEKDEEILARCCNEVSKSLQDIFRQYQKRTEGNLQQRNEVVVEVDTGDCIISSAEQTSLPIHEEDKEEEEKDVSNANDQSESLELTSQSHTETQTEDDSTHYRPESVLSRRRSERRRSSVGTLAQFIKRNSLDASNGDHNNLDLAFNSKGVLEASMNFRFRSPDGETIRRREHERRQSDSDYLIALSKRLKMDNFRRRGSTTEC